jgi:hypothetical protein
VRGCAEDLRVDTRCICLAFWWENVWWCCPDRLVPATCLFLKSNLCVFWDEHVYVAMAGNRAAVCRLVGRWEKTVSKAIYISKFSFYQDRLGTNIGKALKNRPFLTGNLYQLSRSDGKILGSPLKFDTEIRSTPAVSTTSSVAAADDAGVAGVAGETTMLFFSLGVSHVCVAAPTGAGAAAAGGGGGGAMRVKWRENTTAFA